MKLRCVGKEYKALEKKIGFLLEMKLGFFVEYWLASISQLLPLGKIHHRCRRKRSVLDKSIAQKLVPNTFTLKVQLLNLFLSTHFHKPIGSCEQNLFLLLLLHP